MHLWVGGGPILLQAFRWYRSSLARDIDLSVVSVVVRKAATEYAAFQHQGEISVCARIKKRGDVAKDREGGSSRSSFDRGNRRSFR
jgi:hypothetical protein